MKNKTPAPVSCDWIPGDGREEKTGISCDWSPAGVPTAEDGTSRFHRFQENGWDGIEPERYKAEDGGWAAIARHVLVGARGESARFDLRYFEIAPGGYSSLEKHVHVHVVVCVRGRGQVLLDGEVQEMNFLDTVYIAPDDPHQLINPFDEPFGFFCIVDHDRDRPRGLDEAEMERVLASAASQKIRP